jgi:hypothetical protein
MLLFLSPSSFSLSISLKSQCTGNINFLFIFRYPPLPALPESRMTSLGFCSSLCSRSCPLPFYFILSSYYPFFLLMLFFSLFLYSFSSIGVPVHFLFLFLSSLILLLSSPFSNLSSLSCSILPSSSTSSFSVSSYSSLSSSYNSRFSFLFLFQLIFLLQFQI